MGERKMQEFKQGKTNPHTRVVLFFKLTTYNTATNEYTHTFYKLTSFTIIRATAAAIIK